MSPSISPFDKQRYLSLMDGLECNELKLSIVNKNNLLFRFDAEYFNKTALKIIDRIHREKFDYLKDIFDISKLAGFEFTNFFTEANTLSNDNYIALTSKNIQKEELVLSEFITIDKYIADTNLKRSKLKCGDVVLSYTGEYRRALTLRQDNFYLGPNVCRMTPKKVKTLSYYYSAFLNSKTGQVILDREKTFSAQPTVAMKRIRMIPVPKLENNVIKEIESLMQKYTLYLDMTSELYDESLRLLEKDLHKLKLINTFDNKTIISKSNMILNKRIDSEYYMEKYLYYQSVINNYPEGIDDFEIICDIKDKNFVPKDDVKYKYIELSNVGKIGFVTSSIEDVGRNLPTRARRIVHKGDVIISSIEGSLTSCAIIGGEHDGAICSNGFYVLKSKVINPETLLLLFKSELMQNLLKQQCSGTILTNITKENLKRIKLPYIRKEVQEIISTKIKKAYYLYHEALDIYRSILNIFDSRYFDIYK